MCFVCGPTNWVIGTVGFGLGLGIAGGPVAVILATAVYEYGLDGLPSKYRRLALGFGLGVVVLLALPYFVSAEVPMERLTRRIVGATMLMMMSLGLVQYVRLRRQEAGV